MANPHADRPTEIDLEMEQRQRLMDVFSFVETYDGRESVLKFCENILKAQCPAPILCTSLI